MIPISVRSELPFCCSCWIHKPFTHFRAKNFFLVTPLYETDFTYLWNGKYPKNTHVEYVSVCACVCLGKFSPFPYFSFAHWINVQVSRTAQCIQNEYKKLSHTDLLLSFCMFCEWKINASFNAKFLPPRNTWKERYITQRVKVIFGLNIWKGILGAIFHWMETSTWKQSLKSRTEGKKEAFLAFCHWESHKSDSI